MLPSFPDLDGATALVTGSSRGIGSGLADALEASGVRVLRHGSHLDSDASRDIVAADLSTAGGVEHLARELEDRFDHLDILVNNAGTEHPTRFVDLQGDAVRRTLEVNLVAPLLLTSALVPQLRAGTLRSVINISSIHDSVPYAGNVAYVASKAGLEAAGRTIARELAADGIRVNTVAPGAIETDLNREVIAKMSDEFASWIPLGRVGAVDDLIGAVLYLASGASSYVTGSRILIDGGYSQALLRYGLDS